MWNDEHENVINDFLAMKERRLLIIYIDENNQLQAKFEMPSTPANQFTYFLKSYFSEIAKKETFFKHVQYGNFNGKHLQNLLRLTSGLYAPTFFGNNTWPYSKKISKAIKFFKINF